MRRRTVFQLRKAKDRLHLVEGLLIAILDIDEVIQVIRSSDDSEQARQRLNMEELPYLRLTQVPIHFIVSRHAHDAETIVNALDQAYETLRQAGEDLSLPSD